ncbi:antibiotic biosynthesis monooxygenase family protein [uncultured Shimia sp.]|uniref:putative quinol monooxygenase n=1 Tax=uncultured Shimia sp. TaxID=573152 RepID=UPI0025DA4285|nr:antibiotic biosynthesis monooxygenase family protein [uncultured Shimia sp.]
MKETVVVSFSTDDQYAEHVTGALKTLAAQARTMPGSVSFSATTVEDAPSEFHIRQKWENTAAWQAYLNSDALFDFQTAVFGMLSELRVAKQAPLRTRRPTCLLLAG